MKKYSHRLVRLSLGTVLILVALLPQSCMTDSGDNIIGNGTIVYLSFEGGFYGIKGDDGKSYDPTNLPVEYRKDGMRVRFEVKELGNQASFHMWGIIVEIVHIQSL